MDSPEPGGIVVDSVARSFGDVRAVVSASFQAKPGEVTALVGPNGSGKTTLLLMLASLLAPDSGSIRIAGLDPVLDPKGVRRVMGWMPDALGSWPNLTVRATLELTARLYGMTRPVAAERAADLIAVVDLGDLADRPTKVLSRGQKQRLSLARCLLHDPQVLLLDEPASGLDPGARVSLRRLLRELAAQGRTILISSHILSELEEMTDTAVYLEKGSTVSAERIEAARVASREWRVTALGTTGDLLRALDGAGLAEASRVDGSAVLVALAGGDEEASAVLARLVSAGIRVVSFAPAVGDLEHTFLDLSADFRTGGGAA